MSADISPAQIRGARAMLDWSMLDLARAAGVSLSTVRRSEERDGAASSNTIRSLKRAFDKAGVSLLHDDEGLVLSIKAGRCEPPVLSPSDHHATFGTDPTDLNRDPIAIDHGASAVTGTMCPSVRGAGAPSSRCPVRNRLLASFAPDDFALLEPLLERVRLVTGSILIAPGRPIRQVIFPESGVVSVMVDTAEGRIEIGLIGREGFVGIPVVLGTDQVSSSFIVQADGEALRMNPEGLRAAIAARPSLLRCLNLYTQTMMEQIAQTAYVNAIFDADTQLARWLLMMQDRVGGARLSVTPDVLPAMTGARRAEVTAAMQVLEATGAIRADHGWIEVRDRPKLLALAGESYDAPEREHERLIAEV